MKHVPISAAWWALMTAGCALQPSGAVPPPRESPPRLVSEPCRRSEPRVPATLAALEWIPAASDTRAVFEGEAFPESTGRAYDDPEAAGSVWLQLREIDLDADGDCDLIGKAMVWLSAGGDADGHLLYWWADPAGWRREGPMQPRNDAGLSERSRELSAPFSPADITRFRFGSYLPVRLPEGGLLLLARARPGRGAGESPPVVGLAFDPQAASFMPARLSDALLAQLQELARQSCDQDGGADEPCASW